MTNFDQVTNGSLFSVINLQPNLWLKYFNHWFGHLLMCPSSLFGSVVSIFGSWSGSWFGSIFSSLFDGIFDNIFGILFGGTFGS